MGREEFNVNKMLENTANQHLVFHMIFESPRNWPNTHLRYRENVTFIFNSIIENYVRKIKKITVSDLVCTLYAVLLCFTFHPFSKADFPAKCCVL